MAVHCLISSVIWPDRQLAWTVWTAFGEQTWRWVYLLRHPCFRLSSCSSWLNGSPPYTRWKAALILPIWLTGSPWSFSWSRRHRREAYTRPLRSACKKSGSSQTFSSPSRRLALLHKQDHTRASTAGWWPTLRKSCRNHRLRSEF